MASTPKKSPNGWYKGGKSAKKRKAHSPLEMPGKPKSVQAGAHSGQRTSAVSGTHAISQCDADSPDKKMAASGNTATAPVNLGGYSPESQPLTQATLQMLAGNFGLMNQPQVLSRVGIASDLPPAWANDILVQVKTIGERLNKLDIIEASMSGMKSDIKSLTERMSEIEHSQQFISAKYDESRTANDRAFGDLNHDVSEIRNVLDNTLRTNDRLSEEILDLQSRSMRDNLMFYNIEEKDTENCLDVIPDFCTDKLQVSEQLAIDRAHRIGRNTQGKIRPIVCKFRNFQQREIVRNSSRMLKSSEFYIGEQFPRVIQERRRLLLPTYKKARAEGKKASLVRDRLYVDERIFKEEDRNPRHTPQEHDRRQGPPQGPDRRPGPPQGPDRRQPQGLHQEGRRQGSSRTK